MTISIRTKLIASFLIIVLLSAAYGIYSLDADIEAIGAFIALIFIGVLSFITIKLKNSYRNLEGKAWQRTRELEERVDELNKASKLLRRRDLEISDTRKLLENQVAEMDKIAKRLVRRDFDLLQANETLREIDEAKSRFVSIAAHQLRTPISGVEWTINMLMSGDFGKLTSEQKNVLSEALSMLNRLVKLIADLLTIARIESGRLVYTFSALRIEDICRSIYIEYGAEAKRREISLKLSLPKEQLPSVWGDAANLTIALQNIVENALLYTRSGGSIVITAEREARDPKHIRISVKDTGMGIPDAQKNLVGQKFFRGDNVVREQISGTGLGVYTVERLLDQHRGKLEFESEEGKGSVFSVILPAMEGDHIALL